MSIANEEGTNLKDVFGASGITEIPFMSAMPRRKHGLDLAARTFNRRFGRILPKPSTICCMVATTIVKYERKAKKFQSATIPDAPAARLNSVVRDTLRSQRLSSCHSLNDFRPRLPRPPALASLDEDEDKDDDEDDDEDGEDELSSSSYHGSVPLVLSTPTDVATDDELKPSS